MMALAAGLHAANIEGKGGPCMRRCLDVHPPPRSDLGSINQPTPLDSDFSDPTLQPCIRSIFSVGISVKSRKISRAR